VFVHRLTEPIDEFDGLAPLPEWLRQATRPQQSRSNAGGRRPPSHLRSVTPDAAIERIRQHRIRRPTRFLANPLTPPTKEAGDPQSSTKDMEVHLCTDLERTPDAHRLRETCQRHTRTS
jgi:hypothetical protein